MDLGAENGGAGRWSGGGGGGGGGGLRLGIRAVLQVTGFFSKIW